MSEIGVISNLPRNSCYLSRSDSKNLETKGYKLLKKLGEGAFAKVYLGEFKTTDDKKVKLACKLIDVQKAQKKYKRKFIAREINVLMNCRHPYIIYVHSIYQRRDRYFVFMRYAERGDLYEFLLVHGALSEQLALLWARQIALAIEYLHTLEIAHRDIKCENILITENYNTKLADFGFVTSAVDNNTEILSETFCGSVSYVAPEVIKGYPYYPKIADMWSFGVVIYTMLNKANPFDSTNLPTLYRDQMQRKWNFRSRVESELSSNVKELVKDLMEPEPSVRLTITEVLNSPWLQTFNPDEGMKDVMQQERIVLEEAKAYREKSKNNHRENDNSQLYEEPNSIKILKDVTRSGLNFGSNFHKIYHK